MQQHDDVTYKRDRLGTITDNIGMIRFFYPRIKSKIPVSGLQEENLSMELRKRDKTHIVTYTCNCTNSVNTEISLRILIFGIVLKDTSNTYIKSAPDNKGTGRFFFPGFNLRYSYLVCKNKACVWY